MSNGSGRRWAIFLGTIMILCAALFYGLDPLLENSLRKVAAQMESTGQQITFEDVDVNVFNGHLRLEGLKIQPIEVPNEADSAAHFVLQANVVDLEGVELWRLITKQELLAHAFVLHAPSVEHSFATHKVEAKSDEKVPVPDVPAPKLPSIRIESLVISDAVLSSVDRAGVRPSVKVAGMDLLITDLALVVDAENRPMLERGDSRLDLRGVTADLPPLYRFGIDSLQARYPEVTTRVYGMHLDATVGPKEYHKKVSNSTDLVGVRADSLVLFGFNLVEQFQLGSYRANKVLLYGGLFSIHHDKSIPKGPFKRKPLPSEAIRALPVALVVDTLRATGCEVRYSERMTVADDYGTIAFTHIDALLTGLSNAPANSPADLHVYGTARIEGKARAMLDIRMPMSGDTTLQMHARVEELSASLLNRMTDDLVNVNATSGKIHLLDMHMQGDDEKATGTLDMHYDDLTMALNSSVERAGLLSKVANMVIRSSNIPGEKGYRTTRFAITRKQNGSVFNYLWLALKTGCMDLVLPTSVTKGMKYMKERKNKKKENAK